MKANCPGCGRKVSISSNGIAEMHYPGPEVTLTPTVLCEFSRAEVDESVYKKVCELCKLLVEVDDCGELIKHLPDPHSTLSAEGYCGEHERNYGEAHRVDQIKFHWEPGLHAYYNP